MCVHRGLLTFTWMQIIQTQLLLDHNYIHTTLNVNRPKPDKGGKTFRKLMQINHQEFRDDIIHELVPDTIQLAALVHNYDRTLRQLLNKHTPVKSKIVKMSYKQPWLNVHIKSEIILTWKKGKTMGKRQYWIQFQSLLQPEPLCCKFDQKVPETVLQWRATETLIWCKSNFQYHK